MRWPYALIVALAFPGCASAPDLTMVPAPWDPVENQAAEPTQPSEAGLPQWEQIGTSVRGTPIAAMTLGHGPKRIYVVGGLHGDEPEGPRVAAKLPAALLHDLSGTAGERATVRFVRDVNPDGTAL